MTDPDPKQIVADGYDRIAETHAAWAAETRTEERARYADELLGRLPAGSHVLELGCGTGLPTTRQLAARFRVTGVDLSAQHVALAKANVPTATFLQADMTALALRPGSVDGVAAFYSFIHVPRAEQPGLLRTIARWLRPGGVLVATMGATDLPAGVADNWLGAPMYWSSFDAATNRHLVADAGFTLLQARQETADEFGDPVTFLWIIAQKPAEGIESTAGNDA